MVGGADRGSWSPGDNVLAVVVDARWLDVPPDGMPDGARSVDYLQPGGIYRDAALRIVPQVFISDVFAKPTNVLSANPGVDVQFTIDAASVPSEPVLLSAALLDGANQLGAVSGTRPGDYGRRDGGDAQHHRSSAA